jgi:potassium channel subfamily K, other eukaryote
MNDPGLDEPISRAEGEVNETHEDDGDPNALDEEEEEQSYLIPARWWYASTASPLAAGTFGPIASAFSM